MRKLGFLVLTLAMFLGVMLMGKAAVAAPSSEDSAAALFMDSTDVVACASVAVPEGAPEFVFNQVVMTTPATVACGSTNDEAKSTVNFGEAPSSDTVRFWVFK